jgi:hypothetical protein
MVEAEMVRAFLGFLDEESLLFTYSDLDESYFYSLAKRVLQECSTHLATLPSQSLAVVPLRSIRVACRRLIGVPQLEMPAFFMALGALHATIEAQSAMLTALYNIDSPPELAKAPPAKDMDEIGHNPTVLDREKQRSALGDLIRGIVGLATVLLSPRQHQGSITSAVVGEGSFKGITPDQRLPMPQGIAVHHDIFEPAGGRHGENLRQRVGRQR